MASPCSSLKRSEALSESSSEIVEGMEGRRRRELDWLWEELLLYPSENHVEGRKIRRKEVEKRLRRWDGRREVGRVLSGRYCA